MPYLGCSKLRAEGTYSYIRGRRPEQTERCSLSHPRMGRVRAREKGQGAKEARNRDVHRRIFTAARASDPAASPPSERREGGAVNRSNSMWAQEWHVLGPQWKEVFARPQIDKRVCNILPDERYAFWYSLDCGGGGECQFAAIARGLQLTLGGKYAGFTSDDVRALCASGLEAMRAANLVNWNEVGPTILETTGSRSFAHLVARIRRPGHRRGLEGNSFTLAGISHSLRINFILLNEPWTQHRSGASKARDCDVHSLSSASQYPQSMVLLYGRSKGRNGHADNQHWRLAGYYYPSLQKIYSVFDTEALPASLAALLDKP